MSSSGGGCHHYVKFCGDVASISQVLEWVAFFGQVLGWGDMLMASSGVS